MKIIIESLEVNVKKKYPYSWWWESQKIIQNVNFKNREDYMDLVEELFCDDKKSKDLRILWRILNIKKKVS